MFVHESIAFMAKPNFNRLSEKYILKKKNMRKCGICMESGAFSFFFIFASRKRDSSL